ncbi:MAG: hypothetical protein Q8K63_13640 [Acidimicrobiales bacterium]|nr:hypothetical protein [Acidimicrobiales bacterium]
MKTTLMRAAAGLFAISLTFAACSESDRDSAAQTADDAAERVEDEAGELKEKAEDAFDSFRTGFERSIDEASSGDDEAKEKVLDECRDTLEDLRQNDDPRAEQVGALCQKIRDADDGNAWNEVREEFDEIAS